MKPLSKLLMLVFALITVMFSQSHELIHAVYIWPDGYNADGATFFTYDLHQAETHVNTEDSVGCYIEDWTVSFDCLVWHSEIGNFPDWQDGDTVLAFGSWDSAYARDPIGYGDNVNHTGFYWIYSDIMDATVDPQYWSPNDTLRPLPKPLAVQVGGPSGNIEISINNPAQTSSDTGIYDVLGYYVWADTTGSGTPNYFDKEIGFFQVIGGPGETTVCVDPVSNYENGQNVYWAYYLVAQPDTTAMDSRQTCPGYSSYYLSANSNPIVIIGIEENTQPRVQRLNLQALPSIFCENTRIVFSITKSALVKLVVYNTSGQIIRTLVNDVKPAGEHHIEFDGIDTQGIELPAGIYFYQMQTSEQQLTGRLTKLR